MPQVSIIVPCYNVADDVGGTLDSLCAQTLTDWEAILVDDGSTDATPRVLERYARRDARVRIHAQPNQRLAAARNAGFARARAERILFFDAGDVIEPTALAVLNGLLDAHPEAGAAFSGWRIVGPRGEDHNWVGAPAKLELRFPDFSVCNPVNTDGLLIRAPRLRQTTLFDPALPASEDWDMWARLARDGCVYRGTEEPLAIYRMTPGSHSRRVALMLESGLTVIERTHSADPRCRHADPAYAEGMPAEYRRAAEVNWCTYCMALAFGQSGAAGAEAIIAQAGDRLTGLDPAMLAGHLIVAIPFAQCAFPTDWTSLGERTGSALRVWLRDIEMRVGVEGFAHRCLSHVNAFLRESQTLDDVIETICRRHERAKRIVLYGNGKNARHVQRRLSGRLDVELAVADDAMPGCSIDAYLPATDDQLIVVTPWRNEAMCNRLRAAGAQHGRHFIAWTDFTGAVVS